ncbi:Hypothetical_protein [Hexamita inflata]|uniref:Hypothetical_protein n=1 Tax=Hexamita inflata TaxID=28002 RepID=A0ABP1HYJ9_9EUKA
MSAKSQESLKAQKAAEKEVMKDLYQIKKQLRINITNASAHDIFLVQQSIQQLPKSTQDILNILCGSDISLQRSIDYNFKNLDVFKQLILDDRFVIKNSVSQIAKKLEPAILQIIKCYNISTEQPQIATLGYDATYLTSYSRKLRNGKKSGMSDVKPKEKDKLARGRPQQKPVRNMFLFMLSMVNTNFPTFITCAFFTTSGSASYLTDKIVAALEQIYAVQNINLIYKVVDGDRYIYHNYVSKIYNEIKKTYLNTSKFVAVKQLINQVPQIILCDDLHAQKRCRNFLLEWKMTFSLDLSTISQWQVVDITLLKKLPVFVREDCFNQNEYFKMSDKASINLLNPAHIHEYIQFGYYANAVAELMIFPLFISYINFDESKCYELCHLARKLQQRYLADLDQPGAVQFQKVAEMPYFNQKYKIQKTRQFLTLELMKEIYVRTNSIIDILENQSNINTFALTTSPVESQFGLCKIKCCGKQTPQIMKGVVLKQIKTKAIFQQHREEQGLPIQREKYARVFIGNNNFKRNSKQSLSQQANLIYEAISNQFGRSGTFRKFAETMKKLDEKYEFSEISLLHNYKWRTEVVQKFSIVGSTEQGKDAKIRNTGHWVEQENGK